MFAEDRLNAIVDLVRQKGSVTVPELAEQFDVTASTIRRDLAVLDRAHRVAKVHGGATSLERAHVTRDLTISERSDLHTAEKEAIVAAAIELIEPDTFVYVDSGSTTLRLVERLPQIEGVTYVTDSLGHAHRLMERGLKFMLLGGGYKPETEALVGPDAVAMLRRYTFSCGFWGSNGITERAGFTTPDIDEAEVKRVSMQRTERRYVITDASKFGMVAPVSFADFGSATIITTGDVPDEYARHENVMVL